MDQQQVITFGCRLNIYESEVIKDALTKANASDVIVVNSCAVTKEAERQVKQTIRKLRKTHPDKKIIVTGCAAQLHPQAFAAMPEVDQVIGNQEKLEASTYANIGTQNEARVLVNDIMSVTETASHMISSFEGRARAFVQIQNGCNHRCTFCIIPYARGNSRSIPAGMVVDQVRKLVDLGYKEVVLTGVDLTDYGSDLPGSPTLGNLISRLLKLVPDLPRLRLSSIDVAEIDSQLMELIAAEERLMPHIHISLQAGDNMILKRMKRRHTRENVVEFCHNLRTRRNNLAFGADIIAGFPTETDQMFENTLQLINEAGLQYLHVFPYSERDGTPAARMPQVEVHVRKERAMRLRQAGEAELAKFLKNQIGKTARVIVEKENLGKTENFANIELFGAGEYNSGQILEAKITAVENNILKGNIAGQSCA